LCEARPTKPSPTGSCASFKAGEKERGAQKILRVKRKALSQGGGGKRKREDFQFAKEGAPGEDDIGTQGHG